MNFRLQIAIAIVVLAFGCGSADNPAGAKKLRNFLPPVSSMEGWRIAEGPTEYDSEGLFEYVNGGAPLYLDFGFQAMVHVRYQLGDDPLASVTLDVYDMGSDIGAFGLQRSSRPPGAEVRNWGAEGYRSGTVAAAWKGGVAIQAEADNDLPELIRAMEDLVAQVANAVSGSASLPQIIEPLPRDGLVPFSERIIARDLLSHAFLPGGVLATYRVADTEGILFFSELESDPAAAEAMAGLREHHQKWGEIGEDIDSIGDGGFLFSDPGLGSGGVVSAGTYVAGVHGGLSSEVQINLLGRLVDHLVGLSPE